MKYRINGFTLADSLKYASSDERRIEFTYQERTALTLFFSSKNGFVDTSTLESEIWEERVVTQNSLRKLISGLRLKFDDKDAFKNIRGKGYQLAYERVTPPKKANLLAAQVRLTPLLLLAMLLVVALFVYLGETDTTSKIQRVNTQKVFESNDYILDYDTYRNALYVTARDKTSSRIYRTQNRQNRAVMEAAYTGAFRGIEIHSSGRTVLHMVEDGKCIIKVFRYPLKQQIADIPCSRQNAFPSFDWIDENRFYVTFNVEPAASIRPYIYDLRSKQLEPVAGIDFDTENDKRFIDGFIKKYDGGLFSLRENHLDQMSLMYFKGKARREIFEYRSKPYSFGLSDNALYFVGNNNQLLTIRLTDDVLSQDLTPTELIAPQAVKIDDPLVLDSALYFSSGNSSKKVIRSVSGRFNYTLENGVVDFTSTDDVLSVLATTNNGYAVDQLRQGHIISTSYIETTLSLRHIESFEGIIYLAGPEGIFQLNGDDLQLVSKIKATELASNGQCLMADGESGIFLLNDDNKTFKKIASQGERIFASEQGCLFVDNLTGNIVDEKRQKIATPKMRKKLFEHQGRIVHWYSEGDETYIVDLETGETVAKTPSRALYKRVMSHGNDILYMTASDVHTSILKVELN